MASKISTGVKRKFEEVFEEQIEGHLEDDFEVELFNEGETELIAKSGEDFCGEQIKTEINDVEIRDNQDVKIEILEAEVEHEDINFEDFAEEDGNQVVRVKNYQNMGNAEDRTNSKRKYCHRIPKEKPTPRKAKSSFCLTKKKYDAYGVPYLDTKTIFIPEQFRIQASDVSLATRSIILNIGKLIFQDKLSWITRFQK